MTELLKVHGSQNQFFILDQTTLEQPLTDAELQTLAPRITNPQTGLLGGADGILVVNQPTKAGALAQMRVNLIKTSSRLIRAMPTCLFGASLILRRAYLLLPLRSHPSALTKKHYRLTIWAMNGCLIRWFPSLFLDCVLPASRFLIHI